jgi:putative hemolysin
MHVSTRAADATPNFSRLSLSLATTPAEVREVQRLRYKVFVEAAGLSNLANPEGLDIDEFDSYCDHLIVRDSGTHHVVGTYRILNPNAAGRIGHFYAEQEFDLSRIVHLRNRICETGRACIHHDYRSGSVIMMLWAGLAAYMQREKCEYLIGCASISLADGGHNAAAVFRALSLENLAPSEYRVAPRLPFPLEDRDATVTAQIPPLIRGYLRSGAWVCGEPAWDPDFHCADLFMMLPMSRLGSRYAKHYLKEPLAA